MRENTKRRVAIILFALAMIAPFAASAAWWNWRIIWVPNPGGIPPSIPVLVPA